MSAPGIAKHDEIRLDIGIAWIQRPISGFYCLYEEENLQAFRQFLSSTPLDNIYIKGKMGSTMSKVKRIFGLNDNVDYIEILKKVSRHYSYYYLSIFNLSSY